MSEPLPDVEKKVVYLDQFFFSYILAIEGGGRLPKGHEDFFQAAHAKLKNLVLLQQLVLPHSDIHHKETIVHHSASDLRLLYERFGGDVAFLDSAEVERAQIFAHQEAFATGKQPKLDFGVDAVLREDRNRWLSDMHISVNADYSIFADDTRKSRDQSDAEMQQLIDEWRDKKISFDDALRNEMEAFGPVKRKALLRTIDRLIAAAESHDPMEMFEASNADILVEFQELKHLFAKLGMSEEESTTAVHEFWLWPENAHLPHHRLSSYIFAAFARRAAAGQKKFTRGLMNDVQAISTYAPYVDAMFVDRECAAILQEQPLRDDLDYKAVVFSLDQKDDFLAYLDQIEADTPEDVRACASQIYGAA